jgi:hypothetical protein
MLVILCPGNKLNVRHVSTKYLYPIFSVCLFQYRFYNRITSLNLFFVINLTNIETSDLKELVWLSLHVVESVIVEVTLWPMASQPVRFDVLPLLEQVTRCYIYLSDNYFLYFSCRAPSLTRGRVYNLQCNDASSISSYIATDSLSASSSWCRAPNVAHNLILISLFESYFVFSV